MTNKSDDYKVGFYEGLVGMDWTSCTRTGTALSDYSEGRNHGARERADINQPVTRPDPTRAEMAMAILSGLVAHYGYTRGNTEMEMPDRAIDIADALRAALDRKEASR